MKVKLNIHQTNQIKTVDLKAQTVNHLRFESQSLYQLVDENNQALEQIYWKKQDDDILFFLNEHDAQPILVLHDGNDFLAAMHFPQAEYGGLIQTAVKASEVAATPNWAWVGLGGAALLGAGIAVAKGGSSSDKNQTESSGITIEGTNQLPQKNNAAEIAKQQAEQALKQAESRLQQANLALAEALQGQKIAEDALKAAQDENKQNIAELQKKLNEAKSEVEAAKSEVEAAKSEVEAAKSEAEAAKSEAEAAKSETEAAKSETEAAKSEAEAAKSEAEAAKSEAEAAKSEAEAAKSEAEAAKAEAETIKNNPPQIRFDNITKDNVINSLETNASEIEISGSVNNMQPNDVLIIKVGDNSHTVPVEQGNFALKINGSLLANQPVVSAEIMRDGEKVANTTHTYDVDTHIDTPIITFNPITEDNIINLEESRQNAIEVSGKVVHFNQGEQLLVQIGETSPMRVAIQDDGTFSFWVAGQTFANHPTIQASLTTKDDAGNTATASKMAEYAVDIVAPTPSITLNNIAGDNIINKEESEQAKTEISGTVSGLEEDSQVMLVCSCQSCSSPIDVLEIPVTIQSDNTFRLSLNTEDLLKYDTIKAKVQTQDKAKNIGTDEATQTYRKDLILNKPEITIDNIENVNRKKWLDNDFCISGSLKTDADVPNQEAQITIKINGQVFAESVSHDGEKWTLSVSQNQLQAWDKQTLNVTAEIAVRDEAGNTNNANSEVQSFHVSINAPELSIDLNEIGRIQPNQDLAISGKVTGTFKPTDKVIVLVGTTPMANQLDIGSDGQFTGTIAKEHLTGNNTVHVLISGSDDFGNPYENVSDSESYSFPSDNDVILSFNDITGDNHINVTEKSQVITVSGKVSGTYADEQKGKTVNMTINNQTLTATVKDDLSFEFHVSGEDLIRHNGYQLSGSLKDGERTVTALKDYTVAPDALAKIHLNDVNLGLAEEIGSVRLSGRLDFSNSLFAQGQNENLVRAMKLKIGNQTFNVGIKQDEHTFFLDLTHEEYQELKGQPISYEFSAYHSGHKYAKDDEYESKKHQSYDGSYNRTKNVLPHVFNDGNGKKHLILNNMSDEFAQNELKKVQVVFDNAQVQNTQQLHMTIQYETTVSGRVSGAKAGDEISITVGDKNYATRVNGDLSFAIQIKNDDLKAVNNIQAALKIQNAKGENINLIDTVTVLQNRDVGDTFVNQHEYTTDRVVQHSDVNHNFAYFIDAIDMRSQYGFLNWDKTPFGGHTTKPTVIKYYFAKNEDYVGNNPVYGGNRVIPGTHEEYSDELKATIHDAYQFYESVTNLKFEHTEHREEADTILMSAELDGWHSGTGWDGEKLILNTKYPKINEFKKHINFHEIFHTLGADHIDVSKYNKFNQWSFAEAERTTEVSIMSYGDHFATLSGRNNLGLYDLAYLHWRFGVNKNRNTGNDVYRFNQYNPMMPDGNVYIWDAAGVDTFDASQESEGVNVNLTPGSWIYRGQISDTFLIKNKTHTEYGGEFGKSLTEYFTEFGNENIESVTGGWMQIGDDLYTKWGFAITKNTYVEGQAFIGYGTQIENLIGSAHADVLKGNKADNNIYGGDGNDQIWGDDGNDYLDGGKGADILYGGNGNDIFVVDNANDQVIEYENEGTDTVYAHVNYRLSDFVENLSLFGNAETGTGNALNNTLQGNDWDNTLDGGAGHDRLNGGRGSDTLIGGSGADTFVFSDLLDGSVDTIGDFTVSEDKIELALSVFSGLTQANLAEHIKYDATTGALSYDPDGAGNADAIHFATLQNKPNLTIDETHFILA